MSKRKTNKPKAKPGKFRPYVEKRTEKYRRDAAYRAKISRESRQKMQARRGTKLKDCRVNLADLDVLGNRRVITYADGSTSRALCLTYAEAAEALMLSRSRVRIWVTSGVLPAPVAQADVSEEKVLFSETGLVPVYLAEEMKAIMKVVGEHQSRMAYIRPGVHNETIRNIAKAVKAIRGRLDIA